VFGKRSGLDNDTRAPRPAAPAPEPAPEPSPMEVLAEMGFTDVDRNAALLLAHNGDVNAVANVLFG